MKEKFKNFFSDIRKIFILVLLLHGMTLLKKTTFFDDVTNKKVTQKKVIKLRLNQAEPEKSKIKKQIVTTEKIDKKIEPVEDTKFLSDANQNVDRQTVAKSIGKFKEAGKGNKNGDAKPEAPKKAKKQKVVKAKKPQRFKKKKKHEKIDFADLTMDTLAVQDAVKQRNKIVQGSESGKAGKVGQSMNNDYVEEVPLGDFTRLNTKEYKYYGFYFRIKQKLEQYWGATLQKKAMALWRNGRRMPANTDKITSLTIRLDSKGNIVKISVNGTSGIQELDDAAIESFNKAGPFPNPPSGMIKNGYAQIEWGFVVKS